MALRLTFAGAAGTVTGSNFLVEGPHGKILVDCGLEQGKDFCEECMYAPFPYDVPSIDALVITHAHLDHIGRAPKLMREGFKGKVYMTAPTADLTDLMLRDSVAILTQEAKSKNLEPMYDEQDIDALMARVEIVKYHTEHKVAPGLSIFLRHTGHILGSASVRIKDEEGVTLAITGDIGATGEAYLQDPEPIPDADVVVMESVYGDRVNTGRANREEELCEQLNVAIKRGGVILMPAFSIERTQLLLYTISNLMDEGKLPKIGVFLDSPLAIHVTDIYRKWSVEYFNDKVSSELTREKDIFSFASLQETLSRGDSQDIEAAPNPKIIMAGAGMSHGGRIGRWEQKYLPNPDTTLFIVGYQAPGSPGRLLQSGAGTVKIDGRPVKVRAKIGSYMGWSAHADRDGLMEFAKGALPRAKTFFTALGEPASSRFLAQRIHDYLGATAYAPIKGDTWEITKQGAKKLSK